MKHLKTFNESQNKAALYAMKNQESELDWDILLKEFGFEKLKEIGNHAYGRVGDCENETDLYNMLYKYDYLNDFLNTWNFKANYYNLYGSELDMEFLEDLK